MTADSSILRQLPSVDAVLRTPYGVSVIEEFGRPEVTGAIRDVLNEMRDQGSSRSGAPDATAIARTAHERLQEKNRSRIRPVFNLTGTVLHTNLGRAVLAKAAIEAATQAMRHALALEFDLDTGKRGERDNIVRKLLCDLTGAEDATVVNNNASAVLLVLNTLANRRDAVVSRGELIEIGGAFRMPDIMARAGTRLVEVGTTNRTHLRDYEAVIGAKTGLVLKVHPSNYRIEGFVAEVTAHDLAALTRSKSVPLVNDLGSGTLVDLRQFGLDHEPTVAEAVAEGADLVTFSGDKLLGGPQAGFVVGRRDLIARLNRNPLKRALRVDKVRLAAIEATLRLYRNPERLSERLPTIKYLARTQDDVRGQAGRLDDGVAAAAGLDFSVSVVDCASQIGSGALPRATLPSAGLAIAPVTARSAGRALQALATAFRALDVPVIGRIEEGALILDLRCLEDEAAFLANLSGLARHLVSTTNQ